MSAALVFLKLGGSLITDKNQPRTPRLDVLRRLADEIAAAQRDRPDLQLVLGHGSGSFGHVPARRYGTRQGVHSAREWQGFVEVWREAAALDRLVVDALQDAGLPALPFPASGAALARAGQAQEWNPAPILAALQAGLLPVVYGDVVFDTLRGGTILSTEDIFAYLAPRLRPGRVLLAGLEPGVWADFPACTRLLVQITPGDLSAAGAGIGASAATDVTGGMLAKVQQSLDLCSHVPGLDVWIFSGERPGAVYDALLGRPAGTRVTLSQG